MKSKIRSFISPFFLTRYYQYKDISKITQKYTFKGSLIDIGCGSKPFKNLFQKVNKYEGIDFIQYSVNKDFASEPPEHYFSNSYTKNYLLPFKDNEYNNSVAFQVLEHHIEPETMISEMIRVTKKSGYILLSVPFLGGIHEEPHDYQRYTKYGLKHLFEKNNCKIVNIIEQGSFFSTIAMLYNEYLNDFASQNRRNYFISLVIYLPFLLGSYVSLGLDKIFVSKKIVFNYLVLAKKS